MRVMLPRREAKRLAESPASSPAIRESVEPRARKILFETYWSPQGWKTPPQEPSPEDLAYARAQGAMFAPEAFTHDGAVKRILAAREGARVEVLAGNLVASLSRRLVHLRPALGSYFEVVRLRPHPFQGTTTCDACGQFRRFDQDFSRTNFARFKWGLLPRFFGVEHAFLLERAMAEPRALPAAEDHRVLGALLTAGSRLPASAKARDLEVAWKPLLESSRDERDTLIEIFIACGVLVPSRVSPEDFRKVPTRSNWTDAAAVWRGDDGVDAHQAGALFGWRG